MPLPPLPRGGGGGCFGECFRKCSLATNADLSCFIMKPSRLIKSVESWWYTLFFFLLCVFSKIQEFKIIQNYWNINLQVEDSSRSCSSKADSDMEDMDQDNFTDEADIASRGFTPLDPASTKRMCMFFLRHPPSGYACTEQQDSIQNGFKLSPRGYHNPWQHY